MHNGCELSGRGSPHHISFAQPRDGFALGFAAASPVRSSELLGGILSVIVAHLNDYRGGFGSQLFDTAGPSHDEISAYLRK